MKVAIYNRYWNSLGGGEKYCGFLAECLAANHEVDLLAHDDVDRALLMDRLDVDLSSVGLRKIPEDDDISFGYQSAKYDVLVNATFGSDAVNRARYGIYICYFPVPHRALGRSPATLAKRLLSDKPERVEGRIDWGDGWFGHEEARRVYRWSTERPTLRVWAPKGKVASLQLLFLRLLPKNAHPTEVEISIEGEVVRKLLIKPGRGIVRTELSVTGNGRHPTVVEFRCNTFKPQEQFGSADPRHLGLALVADKTGRPANGFVPPYQQYTSEPNLEFLESYDEIVSISRYTQTWVKRLWNQDSCIINPPVSLQSRAPKDPIILSVGRFFDDNGGHCKKQAEMVSAFRRLVERGLKGWTYHVVGGCEIKDLPYLRRVQDLARDLPVQIHVDATGSELKELYSRASIFWHATGLDENERLFPERSEHFGITTVEAMSAGVVPIVIGKGGQLEIVEDGVHGHHFKNLCELIDRTWEVIHTDGLLSKFSLAAQERARLFGPELFGTRFDELMCDVLSR